jgi:TolB-like protein/DNA-binding response OmpR family regulator
MKTSILVVARDADRRADLAQQLMAAGYAVELSEEPRRARELAQAGGVRLAVLAPGDFGAAGADLARQLRDSLGEVVLVDGRDDGSLDILERVRSALQPQAEPRAQAPEVLRFDRWHLDIQARSLRRDSGSEISLTRSEFELLLTFVRHAGSVLSRDQLRNAVAGRNVEAYERSVDMLVGRLRRKLETDPKRPRFIIAVPGIGYRFAIKPQALTLGAAESRFEAWQEGRSAQSLGEAATKPLPLPDKLSIAVLPFQNMSGGSEQEYFADGMAEDIITALSRFKSLFVIARNSSFTYKGRSVDIKQVGRELGVQYVLEGSVRRVGEKVRITTQLIDTASGSHVWADRFDGSLHDVFEMQDTVTARVVGSIGPALNEAQYEAVRRKPIENWGSYDYYLQGRTLFYEANFEATLKALDMFRKSVELDPTFGEAHAMLANCVPTIRDIHNRPISETERAEALRSAEVALQLAGGDALVLSALAYVFAFLTGDYERGAELADRALALNTNASHAWTVRGIISVILGEPERALDAFLKAMRLNPLDRIAIPLTMVGNAAAYFVLGRYDEAGGWARKMLALQPNDIRGLFLLAGSAYFSGQLADAEAAAAQIKQCYPLLRAAQLRRVFWVKRPADMEVIEQTIAFIGLPE